MEGFFQQFVLPARDIAEYESEIEAARTYIQALDNNRGDGRFFELINITERYIIINHIIIEIGRRPYNEADLDQVYSLVDDSLVLLRARSELEQELQENQQNENDNAEESDEEPEDDDDIDEEGEQAEVGPFGDI